MFMKLPGTVQVTFMSKLQGYRTWHFEADDDMARIHMYSS